MPKKGDLVRLNPRLHPTYTNDLWVITTGKLVRDNTHYGYWAKSLSNGEEHLWWVENIIRQGENT